MILGAPIWTLFFPSLVSLFWSPHWSSRHSPLSTRICDPPLDLLDLHWIYPRFHPIFILVSLIAFPLGVVPKLVVVSVFSCWALIPLWSFSQKTLRHIAIIQCFNGVYEDAPRRVPSYKGLVWISGLFGYLCFSRFSLAQSIDQNYLVLLLF
jgi:hypothetical protein